MLCCSCIGGALLVLHCWCCTGGAEKHLISFELLAGALNTRNVWRGHIRERAVPAHTHKHTRASSHTRCRFYIKRIWRVKLNTLNTVQLSIHLIGETEYKQNTAINDSVHDINYLLSILSVASKQIGQAVKLFIFIINEDFKYFQLYYNLCFDIGSQLN